MKYILFIIILFLSSNIKSQEFFYKQYDFITNKDSSITITQYKGSETEVSIPIIINGRVVTILGDFCFTDSKNLKTIFIPMGVKELGEYSFYGCTSLNNICFYGNVPSIYYNTTFYDISKNSTVYFLPYTEGWKETFDGIITKKWMLKTKNTILEENNTTLN